MDIHSIRQALRTKSVYDIPLRVTFYARVSSESDEQLNSLGNQVSYYEEFIRKNSAWEYVPGYVDEGLSAATTKKREDFHRMVEDGKAGLFDLIITKEITRFARNTLDSILYTRELLSAGVGVFFQNDNINTFDEDSELRLTIMSGIAQDELRKLSSRVKFGHAQAIKKNVVLGNSRIFGYVKDGGRLVIDEEQEHTYQSESAPRFDAREAARVRMKLRGGMSLLCSATPSVESYYRGKQGVYTLVELSGRYGPARLPSVTILDMQSQEIPAEGLSQELCQEIHQNLQSGEQTILLMNRRGDSTQVKCTSCHTAVECPNCSITMKYHSANNRLMCHYCGYSAPVPESCPVCGSEFMKYTGLGTQRVEEVLRERWPQARVLRMDMDTTMRRDSHERLLGQFRAGEYDIMVGTQMVAKGLDFPNVTLVGVLTVDQMLYSEDFRSYERTFSLVTQVVGRCGRAGKPGRAFIQTYTPENPILLAAAIFILAKFTPLKKLHPICFIALAAEAMGRAEPIGTMLTSLLFGFADALANNMQSLGLPQELVAMTPYVFTVVGLAIYAASTLKRNRKKLE